VRSGFIAIVNLSRRNLLGLALAGSAATVARPALAALAIPGPRRLAFYNLHTGEHVLATYWADGRYIPDQLREIDRVLRDFRTGDVRPIDRSLLDLLHVLQRSLDTPEAFHVISGYRSPRTNEMLRHEGSGVAANSMHIVGKAIDIRVPGRRLVDVRRAALTLHSGGVGYYPKSDFVHVDTGRVRSW
jgi:uncharacterized protein YcbK (DUF882 family)